MNPFALIFVSFSPLCFFGFLEYDVLVDMEYESLTIRMYFPPETGIFRDNWGFLYIFSLVFFYSQWRSFRSLIKYISCLQGHKVQEISNKCIGTILESIWLPTYCKDWKNIPEIILNFFFLPPCKYASYMYFSFSI